MEKYSNALGVKGEHTIPIKDVHYPEVYHTKILPSCDLSGIYRLDCLFSDDFFSQCVEQIHFAVAQ